jgi:hypothetical protein
MLIGIGLNREVTQISVLAAIGFSLAFEDRRVVEGRLARLPEGTTITVTGEITSVYKDTVSLR